MTRTAPGTTGLTQITQFPVSLLFLVLFALAFGHLVARAVAVYQPAEHPPTWGEARWIGGKELATTRYFRRRFDVQGNPEAAYLIVGGPDALSVHLNGRLVAQSRYFGARVTGIYDLRGYLGKGENLIAVRVTGQRWSSSPLLIARLVLETTEGVHRELVSGPEWKVSARELREAAEQIDWTAENFDDHSWPNAVVTPPPDDVANLPLDIPEAIFSVRRATCNIWSADADPRATFVRDLEIPGDVIRGAWLEVGFEGEYAISTNGRRLHSEISSAKTAEVFDVGKYLRPGSNRVELGATSMQRRPRFFARLLVETEKGTLWVPTDGRWLSARETPVAADSYRPVQVLDRVGSRLPDRTARLVLQNLSSEETFYATEWWRVLLYALYVLLAAALGFPLFHIAVRGRTGGVDGSLRLFVQPFVFGLLLLGTLTLLDADPRLRDKLPIASTMMTTVAALVLLWLILMLLEARLRLRSQ